MYYIANFSIISLEDKPVVSESNAETNTCGVFTENDKKLKETVFCQADLWNVHRRMRTIHVTDRFPRTWEGL